MKIVLLESLAIPKEVLKGFADKLSENFETLMDAIVKARPSALKGQYIKSCVVSSTMGPGVRINIGRFGG